MTSRLLYTQLIVLVFLYIVQVVAIDLYLEVQKEWYFTLSHFLGGIWLGFFFAWASAMRGYRFNFLYSLLFFAVVATLWEVFEVLTGGMSPGSTLYLVDTSSDLLAGLIGAGIAGYIVRKLHG